MSINGSPSSQVKQTELAAQQEKKLVKSLRRSDIILFIIAAVIALDTIGTIASGGLEALFWGVFLVITFMIPFSMIFAETGGAFPQEGGPYQWVKYAFGRFIAGITSVLYWITNPIWLGGTLVLVAHEAFSAYVFDLSTNSVLDWTFKIAFVWIAILLAIVSLKSGKIFVNIGAWSKVIVLAMLVGTTLVYGIQNGFQGLALGALAPSIGGFLAVAPLIMFAYVGFEAPNAASEEMFDAANDTAPAIRRGAIIAMLAYLLPVLAILLVIPADQVSGVDSFMGAIETVYTVFGSAGHTLLTITAILFVYALVNQGSSWMIATDRIQAMAAADGTFFGGYFGEFNAKLGTPLRVNMMSGVMSTIFVVAATKLVEGDAAVLFGVVLFCAISTLLVSYLAIVPALIKLKRIYPDVPRAYVVPGGDRGFKILGYLVMFYITVGSIVALFPGLLETVFGLDYNYLDIWGTSKANVLGFTLGTFAVVVLLGIVGYLGAGKVRKNLAD
jgi:amino acid transporter